MEDGGGIEGGGPQKAIILFGLLTNRVRAPPQKRVGEKNGNLGGCEHRKRRKRER